MVCPSHSEIFSKRRKIYSWNAKDWGRYEFRLFAKVPGIPALIQALKMLWHWLFQFYMFGEIKNVHCWQILCVLNASFYPLTVLKFQIFHLCITKVFLKPLRFWFDSTEKTLHRNAGSFSTTLLWYRFSAFWLRSKCSICSYQLNIWYEDHVSSRY